MSSPAFRQECVSADEATEEVIGEAVARFGRDLVLAASFQDCVLIHMATRVAPGIEVLFIDTGFHFEETLAYVELVRSRYDLRLTVLRPEAGDGAACGQRGCCDLRKVEPLDRALRSKRAWMSGLRRQDSPDRADVAVWTWDAKRKMVKVNPLADWSDREVSEYIRRHDLPVHPLTQAGYPSIGCAPTTQPVAIGEHPRSGRWPGTDKTECGIHL